MRRAPLGWIGLGLLATGCVTSDATVAGHEQPEAHRQAPPATSLARPNGPDRAFRWRRMAWEDEHGKIAADAFQRGNIEWQRSATMRPAIADGFSGLVIAADAGWTEHGPRNVAGRTRSLVIHPTQTNRMWAGSVGGGVFASLDGGATWSSSSVGLPVLAIGSLAIDPANPNVLYAGTGEGQFNGDALGGDGIFKSTDAGATWSQLPSTDGWDTVNRLAIAPGNSQLILASKRFGGIQRSTNGGSSWSNPYWAQGSFDVQFDPTSASKAVASVIDFDFGASAWFHRALYSTDGGASWQVASGLDYVAGFSSRIELAYAPSNPAIVYALCGNGGVIWKSTDGGHSYALMTTSAGCGSSWYASPLWVHPTNADFLLCGGYHVFRSTDGGVTLTQISNGYILTDQAHPDIHGFVSDPGFNGTTNRTVYCLTDGGVYVAPDIQAASTSSGWLQKNTAYRTTQFYGAAGTAVPILPATPVTGAVAGLTAKYYTLSSPGTLPNFDALTPYLTTSVAQLNYASTGGNFANSGQADNVGALFTGWLDVAQTGMYTLFTESDDGSRLYVDGGLVVDNNGLHAMQERGGAVALAAGKHALRVEFFEAGGGAGLIARIQGPSLSKQVIATSALSRNGTPGTPGPSPGAVTIVYGGTQDNGSLRVIEDGSQVANLPFGGDGGWCEIDWQDQHYYYGEYVNLQIHRSTDGGIGAGSIFAGLTDAETGDANFIAPFVLDPNDPKRLYAGGHRLWRTSDARAASVTWSEIRAAGTSNISAIAVAPGSPSIVWIAQNDGQVWKSTNALAAAPTWTAIDDNAAANPLPNRYCTRVVIDPADAQVVYACFGGFSSDNIWKTTNGGGAWSKITGSGATALPSVPVRGLARHPGDPKRLYAGTEFGVASTSDGGFTWSAANFGPTNVSVDELRFIPGTTRLLAATHGRGMWSIDLPLPTADLNGDGHVDAADLAILSARGAPRARRRT